MAWTKAHTTRKPVSKRYGRLLVLRRVRVNSASAVMYACRCDCGKRVVVAGGSLRHGSTKSCGCLRHEGLHARKRPYGVLYNNLQFFNRGACMTYEEFVQFIEEHPLCFYCGKGISRLKYFTRNQRMKGVYRGQGLDRISNAKGHTLDNVVSACPICNYGRMRKGYTLQEFKQFICGAVSSEIQN